MANKKKEHTPGTVRYESKCKVCNSAFKDIIEEMLAKDLNPRQILDAMSTISDPEQKRLWEKEDIKEANIRIHGQRHFSIKTGVAVKTAELKDRLQQSKKAFKDGVKIKVDAINTIAHLIDTALIRLDQVDQAIGDERQKHQLTINYFATIKNLIDEFNKLSGDIKSEENIDIEFFQREIASFANIVMALIRKYDDQFELKGKLAIAFAEDFQAAWQVYKDKQNDVIDGRVSIAEHKIQTNINTFNVDNEVNPEDQV